MTGKAKKRFSCDGKRAHDNRHQAEKQIETLVAGGAPETSLRAYRCRHCTKWHIGHERTGYARP